MYICEEKNEKDEVRVNDKKIVKEKHEKPLKLNKTSGWHIKNDVISREKIHHNGIFMMTSLFSLIQLVEVNITTIVDLFWKDLQDIKLKRQSVSL